MILPDFASQNILKQRFLQYELNRFTDWSKYWNMSINPSKCSYLQIYNPRSQSQHINSKFYIDQNRLSEVSNCRYLGLWLDRNLSLKSHISKIKCKLEKHLYHVYYLQHSGLKLFPKTVLQIYKSRSRPCIEYASIFYYNNDSSHSLQTIQNKFIRTAYPCRKSTPIHTLQMIANIQPLQSRVNSLILRHWFRAKYSSSFHPLSKTLSQYLSIQKKKHNHPFSLAQTILLQPTKISVSNNVQPFKNPISALPI